MKSVALGHLPVIPAKAGIQRLCNRLKFLGSRIRGNDDCVVAAR